MNQVVPMVFFPLSCYERRPTRARPERTFRRPLMTYDMNEPRSADHHCIEHFLVGVGLCSDYPILKYEVRSNIRVKKRLFCRLEQTLDAPMILRS